MKFLGRFLKIFFGALVKLGCLVSRFNESTCKVVSCPLDSVLDLVREVFQGAKWNGFFGWVLRVTVTLSVLWNDHLRVALCSESSAFEQWLSIPDTLAVDVEASLDIIDGIDDEAQLFPEFIIEGLVILRINS